MALLVTVALAGLTLAALQTGLAFNREQALRLESEQALFLAEAGLAESLHAMRLGGTGGVATQAVPAAYGNGVLWVESLDVGTDLRQITAAAMQAGGRACLQRLVFHYFPDVFTTAIFSNQSLVLQSNTFVDSFDSSAGSYASQLAALGGSHVDESAVIISNGDIQVDSAADLHADLHPGDGGSATVHPSGDVSGTLEPLVEPRPMPPVTIPIIPSTGNLLVPGSSTFTLTAGDYNYVDFEVRNGALLTVQGPARILIEDFELQSNAELRLDTSGGAIEIYISDEALFRSNSRIVTPGLRATDVAFYFVGGPSQLVELRSNSEFYGTLYAPQGTIDVRSNFEVFGSVAAERVLMASNSAIHFDESLLGEATGPKVYQFGTWTLAPFPVRAWLLRRVSPFALLGLAPGDLPRPHEAHEPGVP